MFVKQVVSVVAVVLILLAVRGGAPWCAQAMTPVVLRINTRHGLENARGAVLDAGLNPETQVRVSASSGYDGKPFLPPDKLLEDGLAHGATLLSSSFSGWQYLFDTLWYENLCSRGVVHVYAYEPRQPQPVQAPPPAVFVTVNKKGGMSGGGIEFGVTTDYMHGRGKSGTPSGVTAQLAGLMACLRYRHPAWNWFDVKAALRLTASNYVAGYDPRGYGYGFIDYRAADALGDAGALPLFPPAAVVARQSGTNNLLFRVNAFKQRRRFGEALFRFASRPPRMLKELTLADITALGGDFVGSSYMGRDPSRYTYRLASSEKAWFVWFTQDAGGHYSRIESYSILGPFEGS